MKLTDPWFAAQFYGHVEAGAEGRGGSFTYQGGEIGGAQGLILWCPCGYGKPEFPIDGPLGSALGPRPHAILVPFSNPRGAPPPPPDHGPRAGDDSPNSPRPRWQMGGAGLEDLTISPSILVSPKAPCWHGFITNGEIR